MKELLKDELLAYLGELTQDYSNCYDYFNKRKIHNKMGAICALLGIKNVEFNSIIKIIKNDTK